VKAEDGESSLLAPELTASDPLALEEPESKASGLELELLSEPLSDRSVCLRLLAPPPRD
jgi:hypothetical protein